MFNICSKTIDFVGDESLFYQRLNAVYQLECDSNFKVYLDHFTESSMHNALTELLQLVSTNPQSLPSELVQAINESEILTVKILRIQAPLIYMTPKGFLRIILTQKYELIRSLKTYRPYGLNDLDYSSLYCVPKERALAKSLIATLRSENSKYYATGKSRFKKVYQYKSDTGEFIKEHLSITSAAASINIAQAAISNCCAGRTKSAGGYIWSYEKFDRLNVKEYTKTAQTTPLGWLSPEERAKEMQKRVKQFMAKHNVDL